MKTVIAILTAVLICGCSATYSKQEIDAEKSKLIYGTNEAFDLAYRAAVKAFTKEIESCKKTKQIYNIKLDKCEDKK